MLTKSFLAIFSLFSLFLPSAFAYQLDDGFSLNWKPSTFKIQDDYRSKEIQDKRSMSANLHITTRKLVSDPLSGEFDIVGIEAKDGKLIVQVEQKQFFYNNCRIQKRFENIAKIPFVGERHIIDETTNDMTCERVEISGLKDSISSFSLSLPTQNIRGSKSFGLDFKKNDSGLEVKFSEESIGNIKKELESLPFFSKSENLVLSPSSKDSFSQIDNFGQNYSQLLKDNALKRLQFHLVKNIIEALSAPKVLDLDADQLSSDEWSWYPLEEQKSGIYFIAN